MVFMSDHTDSLTERIEDYLETVFLVTRKKKFAQAKDISEILGVAPSSVTEMFQKLSKLSYINYQKYSGVTLTKKGEEIAEKKLHRQQILQDFLTTIGIAKEIAEKDAGEIENKASKETILRIKRFIDFLEKSQNSRGWIDHLYYYFETGEFVECQPENRENCPVHSKKMKS